MTTLVATVLHMILLGGSVMVFALVLWAFADARLRWRASLLGGLAGSGYEGVPPDAPAWRVLQRPGAQNESVVRDAPERVRPETTLRGTSELRGASEGVVDVEYELMPFGASVAWPTLTVRSVPVLDLGGAGPERLRAVDVAPESSAAGRPLGALGLQDDGLRVVGLWQDDRYVPDPAADVRLAPGDRVVVAEPVGGG